MKRAHRIAIATVCGLVAIAVIFAAIFTLTTPTKASSVVHPVNDLPPVPNHAPDTSYLTAPRPPQRPGAPAVRPLNVLVVSDGYTDFTQFHADVANMEAFFFTLEPFSTRVADFKLTPVDNATDLSCQYSGRLLTCNDSLVLAAAASSGLPYDKVMVIENNPIYGGSASCYGCTVSVAYNGSYGPMVSTHEFGHALGALLDEYNLYASNGAVANSFDENCWTGSTPPSAWNGVGYQGCNFPNWWREDSCSLMSEITCYHFDALSVSILNASIDAYVNTAPITTTTTTTPPVTASPKTTTTTVRCLACPTTTTTTKRHGHR